MNTKIQIIITIAFLIGITVSPDGSARTPVGDGVFGVGIELGDPTAVTMKIMPSEMFAFQFFVGAGDWYNHHDHYDGNMFLTGIDFVFHPLMIYDKWKTCALNLTFGGGIAVGVFRGWYNDNWAYDWRYDTYYYDDKYYASLFLRFVTGVNLWFKKFPLETFVEITPALQFVHPDPIGFHMFWTVGGRWFF